MCPPKGEIQFEIEDPQSLPKIYWLSETRSRGNTNPLTQVSINTSQYKYYLGANKFRLITGNEYIASEAPWIPPFFEPVEGAMNLFLEMLKQHGIENYITLVGIDEPLSGNTMETATANFLPLLATSFPDQIQDLREIKPDLAGLTIYEAKLASKYGPPRTIRHFCYDWSRERWPANIEANALDNLISIVCPYMKGDSPSCVSCNAGINRTQTFILAMEAYIMEKRGEKAKIIYRLLKDKYRTHALASGMRENTDFGVSQYIDALLGGQLRRPLQSLPQVPLLRQLDKNPPLAMTL